MLRFEGSTQLRQRLVCSTLSGRPIRIDRIRERDQSPGLRDFEACLLRLLEKITDGCVVEINETGEAPMLRPAKEVSAEGPVTPVGAVPELTLQPRTLVIAFCHVEMNQSDHASGSCGPAVWRHSPAFTDWTSI